MAKLSETQKQVIELLKNEGNVISYFRGIGTRFGASAAIEDKEGKHIKSISVATVKALRDKGAFELVKKDTTHSTFRLKNV